VRIRRPLVPDDVRARLGLSRGERVLAAARADDGTWVVATDRALLADGERVAWVDTAHAEWDADRHVLSVERVAGPGLRWAMDEPAAVPETVHERVMASIVLSRRVRLPGQGGARVVARDGGDGLVWQVVVEAGVDPEDAAVRAELDAALAQLHAELGD
jgi:hypothetical protein